MLSRSSGISPIVNKQGKEGRSEKSRVVFKAARSSRFPILTTGGSLFLGLQSPLQPCYNASCPVCNVFNERDKSMDRTLILMMALSLAPVLCGGRNRMLTKRRPLPKSKLGGIVIFDETSRGKEVNRVDFDRTEVTDAGIEHLKGDSRAGRAETRRLSGQYDGDKPGVEFPSGE